MEQSNSMTLRDDYSTSFVMTDLHLSGRDFVVDIEIIHILEGSLFLCI